MKNLLTLAILVVVVACASDTEQKSLHDIGATYNAKTAYSKNFKSSVGEKTVRAFTVTVSESKLIDSLNPNVSSSNIALMVYENLSEKEKDNYTAINVNLLNLKKDSANYTFQKQTLSELSEKAATFYTFTESLIKGNFGKIDEIKDENEIKGTVAHGVKKLIAKNEKLHGDLIGYKRFGIAEARDERGSAYQFQGFLEFENGKLIPFLGVVDTALGKDKLIGFNIFDKS